MSSKTVRFFKIFILLLGVFLFIFLVFRFFLLKEEIRSPVPLREEIKIIELTPAQKPE